MEPDLKTAPELAAILEQLQAREPISHRPEFGTTRPDFEAMTEPDFWEMGAFGQRYSRAYVLDVLESDWRRAIITTRERKRPKSRTSRATRMTC